MKLKIHNNSNFGIYTAKTLTFKVIHSNKLPSVNGGYPNWTVNLGLDSLFIFNCKQNMKLKVDTVFWYQFSETGLYKNCLNGRQDKLVNKNDLVNVIHLFIR